MWTRDPGRFPGSNRHGRNTGLPGARGNGAGEPVDHNDDLFGPTVNLARRICDVATPGEVFVSHGLKDLGAAKGFSFADEQAVALHGFANPVTVFKLVGKE
jgi:class 3 adenylate cyclase